MKLFVWDFHGVLEKDNHLAVFEISNDALAKNGYKERLSKKDNVKFVGLKWYEYFERILPGSSKDEHMTLQATCFKLSEENRDITAKYVKPNDYAEEVLKTIKEAGHDQILLSNTRSNDILWYVKTVNLEKYFPESKIFGVNAHQRHGNKKEALKEYISGKDFDSLVIIGDSKSDMDLKCVAGGTTYFYNHPHILSYKIAEADYIISDLRKVLKEL